MPLPFVQKIARELCAAVFVCHASIGIVGLLICANNISQSLCAIYLRHTEANAFIRSLSADIYD